ncbi:hypothetical protein B0H17DRAFT_1149814 [Mycena rosella]|uniref:Uncharacterized protein n=1 Tax=Mycena rosella TaxID=1033263 RepID=A0AAD7BZL3_MYCRO|nr:hypothetical protein B0H17DRAFT_1149814 [Mycena rosella]
MAPKPWTNEEQYQWLHTLWGTCELPARESGSDLTDAQEEQLGKYIERRKKQLREWFRNHTQKARGSGDKPAKKDDTQSLAAALWKVDERHQDPQLIELWHKKYPEKGKAALEAAGYYVKHAGDIDWVGQKGAMGPPGIKEKMKQQSSARMAMWRRVTIAVFAGESDEVKDEMAEELRRFQARSWRGRDRSSVRQNPRNSIVRRLHALIAEKTGWVGISLFGGPTPNDRGNLNFTLLSSGVTPAGNNFPDSHPNWEQDVGKHFSEWLRRCFSRAERDAMALQSSDILDDLLAMPTSLRPAWGSTNQLKRTSVLSSNTDPLFSPPNASRQGTDSMPSGPLFYAAHDELGSQNGFLSATAASWDPRDSLARAALPLADDDGWGMIDQESSEWFGPLHDNTSPAQTLDASGLADLDASGLADLDASGSFKSYDHPPDPMVLPRGMGNTWGDVDPTHRLQLEDLWSEEWAGSMGEVGMKGLIPTPRGRLMCGKAQGWERCRLRKRSPRLLVVADNNALRALLPACGSSCAACCRTRAPFPHADDAARRASLAADYEFVVTPSPHSRPMANPPKAVKAKAKAAAQEVASGARGHGPAVDAASRGGAGRATELGGAGAGRRQRHKGRRGEGQGGVQRQWGDYSLPLDTPPPEGTNSMRERERAKKKQEREEAASKRRVQNTAGPSDLVILPRLPGAPMPPVPELGRPGRERRAPKTANDNAAMLEALARKAKEGAAKEKGVGDKGKNKCMADDGQGGGKTKRQTKKVMGEPEQHRQPGNVEREDSAAVDTMFFRVHDCGIRRLAYLNRKLIPYTMVLWCSGIVSLSLTSLLFGKRPGSSPIGTDALIQEAVYIAARFGITGVGQREHSKKERDRGVDAKWGHRSRGEIAPHDVPMLRGWWAGPKERRGRASGGAVIKGAACESCRGGGKEPGPATPDDIYLYPRVWWVERRSEGAGSKRSGGREARGAGEQETKSTQNGSGRACRHPPAPQRRKWRGNAAADVAAGIHAPLSTVDEIDTTCVFGPLWCHLFWNEWNIVYERVVGVPEYGFIITGHWVCLILKDE